MNSINRTSLFIGIVVGLIAGLLLGMALFWGLFPVQWTDARPYDLAPEARADYVQLAADSFSLDRDPQEAARHFEGWTDAEKQEAFAEAIAQYEQEGMPAKAQAVQDLAMVLGVTPGAAGPEPEEPAEAAGLIDRLRVPCLVFFFALLVLVLGWIGLRMALRRRGPVRERPVVAAPPVGPAIEDWQGTGRPPLGHFITTYQLGEDTYDESFSIETPTGDFMGECGVGISDTIGTGDHDKVTAFEVWLFDKSDIRTVTKVLMSEHVFQDAAQRAKLVSKGEPVLAQPGAPFLLETSSLQVEVRIAELIYGNDDLPPKSYFTKLTIELVATAK
ncbi:MAG: hypothetical protein EHM56_00255 [Chloroflexi bacterium]|nr:MAG: hypothetical protein EHM56_00255 [Chloroflexota bacterium]